MTVESRQKRKPKVHKKLKQLKEHVELADFQKAFYLSCCDALFRKLENSVIISHSPEGLQNRFDKLSAYCKNWKLAVNEKKTNV